MFRPHGTQGEVFDAIGKPIVASVMAGYNSCIMVRNDNLFDLRLDLVILALK
jgi:hypothetical protein